MCRDKISESTNQVVKCCIHWGKVNEVIIYV